MTRSVTICLRRIRNGDRSAWFEIWERVWNWSLAKSRHCLKGNHQLAEEIACEAVADVAKSLERDQTRIVDRDSLHAYLGVSTFHRSINALNKSAIAHEQLREISVLQEHDRLIMEDFIVARITNEANRKIALLLLEGYNATEIARQLGIATRTMRRRVSQVLDSLKNAIASEGL